MVGDGTNDMLAMREAAAGISLAAKISPSLLQKQAKNSFEQPQAKQTTLKKGKSSSRKNQNPETSLLNEDNRRFSFIRKFIDRIIEKFNSVDENEIVQPSTIASSFSTSDVNPIIVLEILNQSLATIATVKFSLMLCCAYLFVDFFFRLQMFTTDTEFTEFQQLFEALPLQVLSMMVMSMRHSIQKTAKKDLKHPKRLFPWKLLANIIFQNILTLLIIQYAHTMIAHNFSNQCPNDSDLSVNSPCKTIYHYLFCIIEFSTILFYYPGSKFFTNITETKFFRGTMLAIGAVVYMIVAGKTPSREIMTDIAIPLHLKANIIGVIGLYSLSTFTFSKILNPF